MSGQGRQPPPLSLGDAVFVDFDGTLASLQDDPDTVYLMPGLAEVLEAAAGRLDGAFAVLSGRDAGDLAARVPASLWRAGNHGLIQLAPGEAAPKTRTAAPPAVRRLFEDVCGAVTGTRLETKGPVLALHYRNAPGAAGEIGIALAGAGLTESGYCLQHGKFVFEAKPEGANKGKALLGLMQKAPFAGRRAVMIGDDTTDEDAFIEAARLGGVTVKVGPGDTVAQHRLNGVFDVHAYLKELATA